MVSTTYGGTAEFFRFLKFGIFYLLDWGSLDPVFLQKKKLSLQLRQA